MTDDLVAVLTEAQRHGWVGAGPLEPQLRHAGAFTQVLGEGPGVAFDLGSGGGLPALPVALDRPAWRWVLVEAQLRRADHLGTAVRRLGLGDRVVVRHARAEDVGRDAGVRGTADAVTARSFGPPAVVAECAAPLLVPGGRLLVAEPPAAASRWPTAGLERLGLQLVGVEAVAGVHLAILEQVAWCPARFPRRPGRPQASPLF